MKVKKLIELLKQEDPNRIVVMARDGEGNSFSPLADVNTAAYAADTTWSGEIGIEKLTPELEEEGYSKLDVMKGKPALVLWPTN